MTIDATYTCYGSGMLSYFVAYIALSVPLWAWLGVKGVGYYDSGQLIIIVLNAFWLALSFSNVILQETFREQKLCQELTENGHVLYGNPAYEAQALAAFITFIVLFNYFRTRHFRRNHIVALSAILLFVTWGLWWTGNYTFLHVLSGLAIGSAQGVLLFVCIYYFWAEDIPAILSLRPSAWLGLQDSFCVPAKGLSRYCEDVRVGITPQKRTVYRLLGLDSVDEYVE